MKYLAHSSPHIAVIQLFGSIHGYLYDKNLFYVFQFIKDNEAENFIIL